MLQLRNRRGKIYWAVSLKKRTPCSKSRKNIRAQSRKSVLKILLQFPIFRTQGYGHDVANSSVLLLLLQSQLIPALYNDRQRAAVDKRYIAEQMKQFKEEHHESPKMKH